MNTAYLKPAYQKIYHEDFSYSSFEQRMKMQKAVYLLQEMGVPVGDYAFFWYKHGPYSQDLQEAMHAVDHQHSSTNITFSSDMDSALVRLSEVLNREVSYKLPQWAECLASLHYLRSNVFSASSNPEEIVAELKRRKPHLDDDQLNLEALKLVTELCA